MARSLLRPPRVALLRVPTERPTRTALLYHTTSERRSEATAAAQRAQDASTAPPIKRITIADIKAHRMQQGRLMAGTAAYSDSDMFKVNKGIGKPLAKQLDYHLSAESLSREPCILKEATKLITKPGLISLGGGLPRPENFPIESLKLKVAQPPNFSQSDTTLSGRTISIGKYDVQNSSASEYDLSIGLNYSQATGSAQMLRWVTEHTELVCNPPYADWRCALTIGSTGALELALRMFCDRDRQDTMLTEEYSFSTALETAVPLGIKVAWVAMDEQGLIPEVMDDVLTNWDPSEREAARKPHLLYTVPSGQNPTGATQGEQRRRQIYALAQKHDLIIIEDEPYYFLQMPSLQSPRPAGRTTLETRATSMSETDTQNFLSSLLPTLLSLDTDGRVLRLDSFSKVLVPGARLGWVTGSADLVERYIRHAEVSSQGPSGFSQLALHGLLDDSAGGWGHDAYLRWLMWLRDQYTVRRDVMLEACEGFLPKEVVSWTVPRAGIFLWFQVDHHLHPDFPQRSIQEIEDDVHKACLADGVLVAKGSWFRAEPEKPPTAIFFRATFAAATHENTAEAIRRLGSAVRKCFQIQM